MMPSIRTFETGATRDTNNGKLEYRRFFSPMVLKERAEYMHRHRIQTDGSLRDPDNWKKGMPRLAYADSLDRHVRELMLQFETNHTDSFEQTSELLCAIMFNAEGLLYELLIGRSV